MTTTLTGRNQITIPAALAKAYALKAGTQIEWVPGKKKDEIICRILPELSESVKSLRGAGSKYLKTGEKSPVDALIEERATDDLLGGSSL